MNLLESLVEMRERLPDDAKTVQAAIDEIRSLRAIVREASLRLRPAIAAGMEPEGAAAIVRKTLAVLAGAEAATSDAAEPERASRPGPRLWHVMCPHCAAITPTTADAFTPFAQGCTVCGAAWTRDDFQKASAGGGWYTAGEAAQITRERKDGKQ